MAKSRGHNQQVLWHTEWENPVSEYYTEGPNTASWLMDFKNPQLTGVGKCVTNLLVVQTKPVGGELNTWEWENSKVVCATLSIPYDNTLLIQGTQCPTSNLVMPQLYQMITKFEIPSITYVHTAQKETIPVHAALEKASRPEMMKGILKVRTQMVERMYEYFDSNWSESHRVNDSDTHMLTLTCCSLCNQKYNLTWGLQ